MRKFILLILVIHGMVFGEDAEFILMKNGQIHPEMAIATIADITANAVQAIAVAQAAVVVSNAAAEVQGMIDSVTEVVNSVEGIGYIRGYALDFGVSGVAANTNVTCTILRYDHGISNDVSYVYSDVYAYFNEEPSTLPVLHWAASPRNDATWTALTSVATIETQITVDATIYDCYRITVALPIDLATAFLRVFAEATQQAVGAYLPVRNGIKVGAFEPLTAETTCGTNTFKWVGGVRVQ